jgi:hypothetical protein
MFIADDLNCGASKVLVLCPQSRNGLKSRLAPALLLLLIIALAESIIFRRQSKHWKFAFSFSRLFQCQPRKSRTIWNVVRHGFFT